MMYQDAETGYSDDAFNESSFGEKAVRMGRYVSFSYIPQ